MTLLIPDLVYSDGAFRSGLTVQVDTDTGRIHDVAPATAAIGPGVRLRGRALVPGFTNVHSHAFQRLIRGQTQWRPAAVPEADFWSWREAMYAVALSLSPEDVERVSRFCFLEMLRAGITTVGEFHYLQRDLRGERYADGNELAQRVLAAAHDVGIRICLLNVCYATGTVNGELRPEQRRFATPDLDVFLADTEALHIAARDQPLVTVGVAPHSIRAVTRPWLRPLHDWAVAHDVPFHMHVSEQPAEVAACEAVFGMRPVELLDAEGVLDARMTAIHATHLTGHEIALLGAARACIGACPSTERDLGDGFLQSAELIAAGAHVALGSDSQSVLDFFEEMRLVEYNERLKRLRRIVLAVPEGDDRLGVAPRLFAFATSNGARSLRLESGSIAAGQLADLTAIDLDHESLAGWTPESLPALLALAAPAAVVQDVWVAGVQRIEAGRHLADEAARQDYTDVAARIWHR